MSIPHPMHLMKARASKSPETSAPETQDGVQELDDAALAARRTHRNALLQPLPDLKGYTSLYRSFISKTLAGFVAETFETAWYAKVPEQ